MRKKIVVAVGLVVAVLAGTLLTNWWLASQEPSLREGMTLVEVKQLLGEPNSILADSHRRSDAYYQGPDTFGNRRTIIVNYDTDGRVKSWFIEALPRARPWWLGG